MDFGSSFRYVFKDQAWFKKLVSVALWGLIPVIGVLVIGGWGLKVGKMVIDGQDENELPKVEFGADLLRGFFAAVIDLVYILPALIFLSISLALIGFGPSVGMRSQWILIILGALFGLAGFLFLVLWFFVATVAFANFLAKGTLKAAFNLRELFKLLKGSFSSWLLVIAGQVLAMMIIAPLGSLFFGIGLLFSTAYAAVVYAHLLGQAYHRSAELAR